jgi:CheY-like chemotaxis protein
MDTILFVDDEPEYVADYVEELKKSYHVDFCRTAQESVQKIRENNDYQALVLDVQMPAPEGLSPAATSNGVDTGLWVLREVQETIVKNSLPVILLTNRNPDIVKSGIQKLGLPDKGIEIRPKVYTSYEKLSKLLDGMLIQLISSEATVARIWPDKSAALSVTSDSIGWLEFDISEKALPKGACVGDRFQVMLKLDRHNNVVSYQIPADCEIVFRSADSFGAQLSKGIPNLPENLNDPVAMADYRKKMANWSESSGLKQHLKEQ